jgi:TM2 domain-containing membrane protein YozV
MNQKSKFAAILLAFFLGCWGVHLFYLGENKKGAVYLIIGIFGLFFWFPLIVTGILAIIDIFKYLFMSDAEFAAKYSGGANIQNNAGYQAPNYSQPVNNQPMSINAATPEDFTFCTTCGTKIPKGTKFCPSCGNAQNV